MSSDEEDEDQTKVRKVMPGEAAAAALAAANATANALQTAVRILPALLRSLHIFVGLPHGSCHRCTDSAFGKTGWRGQLWPTICMTLYKGCIK